jgi:hypothetical protein
MTAEPAERRGRIDAAPGEISRAYAAERRRKSAGDFLPVAIRFWKPGFQSFQGARRADPACAKPWATRAVFPSLYMDTRRLSSVRQGMSGGTWKPGFQSSTGRAAIPRWRNAGRRASVEGCGSASCRHSRASMEPASPCSETPTGGGRFNCENVCDSSSPFPKTCRAPGSTRAVRARRGNPVSRLRRSSLRPLHLWARIAGSPAGTSGRHSPKAFSIPSCSRCSCALA